MSAESHRTTENFSQQDENTENFSQKKKKNVPKHRDLRNRASAILSASNEFSQTDIAKILNVNRATILRNKDKIEKNSIQTPHLQRLSKKYIKDCLSDKPLLRKVQTRQGEVLTIEDYPTYADKQKAASLVLERTEPTIQRIQSQSVNINIDADPVDLEQYRMP